MPTLTAAYRNYSTIEQHFATEIVTDWKNCEHILKFINTCKELEGIRKIAIKDQIMKCAQRLMVYRQFIDQIADDKHLNNIFKMPPTRLQKVARLIVKFNS